MGGLLTFLALILVTTAVAAQVGPPTSRRMCGANRQPVLWDGADDF